MFSISIDAGPIKRLCEVFPKKAKAALSRALRRTGTAVQGAMIAGFRQRGVGRAVYGQNPAGARKGAISRGKLRTRDNVQELPVKIKGLAQLQEQGGRTKTHVIRPKHGKYLVIGGRPILGPVNHPGSSIRPIPFANSAATQNEGTLARNTEQELQKLITADYA